MPTRVSLLSEFSSESCGTPLQRRSVIQGVVAEYWTPSRDRAGPSTRTSQRPRGRVAWPRSAEGRRSDGRAGARDLQIAPSSRRREEGSATSVSPSSGASGSMSRRTEMFTGRGGRSSCPGRLPAQSAPRGTRALDSNRSSCLRARCRMLADTCGNHTNSDLRCERPSSRDRPCD